MHVRTMPAAAAATAGVYCKGIFFALSIMYNTYAGIGTSRKGNLQLSELIPMFKTHALFNNKLII
jgi:hypothetical protein